MPVSVKTITASLMDDMPPSFCGMNHADEARCPFGMAKVESVKLVKRLRRAPSNMLVPNAPFAVVVRPEKITPLKLHSSRPSA